MLGVERLEVDALIVAVLAMAAALAIALAWRHPWAPAVGALVGVAVAIATGAAAITDIEHALHDLWRPMISIIGIMTTTACAAELGIFTRLAAWIEPRTRGPVRHAFRFVFVVAALTAAILSNDAAQRGALHPGAGAPPQGRGRRRAAGFG